MDFRWSTQCIIWGAASPPPCDGSLPVLRTGPLQHRLPPIHQGWARDTASPFRRPRGAPPPWTPGTLLLFDFYTMLKRTHTTYGSPKAKRAKTLRTQTVRTRILVPRGPIYRPEIKNYDTSWAGQDSDDVLTQVPTTGALVSGIAQGTTGSSRVGRRITVSGINIKGYFHHAEASSHSQGVFYVIWDKACNGANPVISDIFAASVGSQATTEMRNLDHVDRFQVLARKVVQMYGGAAGSSTVGNFEINLKNLKIPVSYDATTGAITDLSTSNIFLVAGSNTSGTATAVDINGYCRIRYYDM